MYIALTPNHPPIVETSRSCFHTRLATISDDEPIELFDSPYLLAQAWLVDVAPRAFPVGDEVIADLLRPHLTEVEVGLAGHRQRDETVICRLGLLNSPVATSLSVVRANVLGSRATVQLPSLAGWTALKKLCLEMVNLTKFPDILKLGLTELVAYSVGIHGDEFPSLAGTTLESLHVQECGIGRLPELPQSMHSLFVEDCDSIELPDAVYPLIKEVHFYRSLGGKSKKKRLGQTFPNAKIYF
jgi:hypothetical protein